MTTTIVYLIIAVILVFAAFGAIHLDYKMFWKKYDNAPFNFPFKYKGRTAWHSRACAVAGFIFCKNALGDWCILANQRGKGAPDYNFYYVSPCGYLDYNENGEEAISRESLEECGVDIDSSAFQLYSVQTDPNANKQNVTIRYFVKIDDKTTDDESLIPTITNLGEKDEVADVRWIPIANLKEYNWAFGHKEIIEEIFENKIVM